MMLLLINNLFHMKNAMRAVTCTHYLIYTICDPQIVDQMSQKFYMICKLKIVDCISQKLYAICCLWIVQSNCDGNVCQLRVHNQHE